jgi:hypothetical protein
MRGVIQRAAALDNTGLIHEIQLARARLAGLIAVEPTNHDVLLRMMGTITRMVAINHALTPTEERALGGALQELLAELLPDRTI